MQGRFDEEREQVRLLREHQEHMEDELRGYKIRNREYEQGIYGLPQVRACMVVSRAQGELGD